MQIEEKETWSEGWTNEGKTRTMKSSPKGAPSTHGPSLCSNKMLLGGREVYHQQRSDGPGRPVNVTVMSSNGKCAPLNSIFISPRSTHTDAQSPLSLSRRLDNSPLVLQVRDNPAVPRVCPATSTHPISPSPCAGDNRPRDRIFPSLSQSVTSTSLLPRSQFRGRVDERAAPLSYPRNIW